MFSDTIPVFDSRTYSGVTNNQYLGAVAITNQPSVQGPIVVSVYLSFNSGGGRAVSIKPEIYYFFLPTTTEPIFWEIGIVQPRQLSEG